MKRTGWFITFILAAGLLAAQSVTVSAPATGDAWEIGKTYSVVWTSSGSVGNKVNIFLIGSGRTKIASKVANNGSYSWTIPASVAPGSYKIRVEATVTGISDSSGSFSIASASAPPPPPLQKTITVTAPNGGQSWQLGTSHAITWTSSNLSGTVTIDLMVGPNKVGQVASGVGVAKGSFGWQAGLHGSGQAEPGTNYRIRLTHIPGNETDISDANFTLIKPSSPGNTFIPPPINPPVQLIPQRTVVQPQRVNLSDFTPVIKIFQPGSSSVTLGDELNIKVVVENSAKANIIEVATGKTYPVPLQDKSANLIMGIEPQKSGEIKLVAENGIQSVQRSFMVNVLLPAGPQPPSPGIHPVIDKFETTPKVIAPFQSVSFNIQYHNALSAKIYQRQGSVRNLLITLPNGTTFNGVRPFTAPQVSEVYTFDLVVQNLSGEASATTFLTIRPEMKIILFQSNATQFTPGESIVFSYQFKGAEEAILQQKLGSVGWQKIHELPNNNCGEVKGTYPMVYQGADAYRLCLKNSFDPVLYSKEIQVSFK